MPSPRSGQCARLIAASILGLLVGWLTACSGSERGPSAPRLVILYATCTLNKDYLSPYSPEVAYTPHLQRLARRSTVFTSHRTESAQSGIAFASIFSGVQAPVHGVFSHPREIPDSVELITEAFAANGYDTYSYLYHFLAEANLGYAQGVPAENAFFELLRPDHQAFRQVLDRLDQDPEYRALIIANFTVTHAPYSDVRLEAFCGAYPDQCTMDPETFERMKNIHYGHPNISYDYRRAEATRDFSERELGDFASALDLLYRANVHHLDGLVGRLVASIERRGLLDSTAIAFTADHGETLYRETAPYSWGHGYQLSPDAVNVPFILHAPGVGRGESYSGVTRSIDVFPTLAGLARIELASVPGRGVDLSPVLRGEQMAPDLLAFSHSSVLSEPVANSNHKNLDFFRWHFPRRDPELMWVAVKKANRVYKLQRFHEGEFEPAVFDTAVDPHELADVHDPADPAGRQIFERLSRYRAGLVESFGSWMSEGRELPPEQQEELLRALGYIE
ncbi:MAG: sulfatase-like hydrolase/transferase [Myxococcota bacterium]